MAILNNFRARTQDRLVPFQATVELTYRCNERCGHCYLATYDDREDGRPPLTLEEWQGIFDQLAQAGTLVLIFIGGEAMMHPQFWELADYGSRKNFGVSLITNGLLLDDAAADRMAALNFYQVACSLYSMDPEIHDRMTRRKGSHARTMAAIERLLKRKIEVRVNCLLTSDNIDTVDSLEDWAKSIGAVPQFDPMVTPKSDGSLGSTVTRATPEQLLRYYRRAKERGKGPLPMPEMEANDPVCSQGRGKCAVNVYGDLLTCLDVRDPIGNLRERTFQELWRSPKAEALRGFKASDLKFDAKEGCGSFCDHCPGLAMAEAGDPMSPVPFLMELARIKQQVFLET